MEAGQPVPSRSLRGVGPLFDAVHDYDSIAFFLALKLNPLLPQRASGSSSHSRSPPPFSYAHLRSCPLPDPPHSYAPELCLTLKEGCGLIILTLRRSRNGSTMRRGTTSMEFSLAQFSTVCTRHPTYTSICLYPIYSVLLGVLIILFFRCITALLNPANRRGDDIKWCLVSYTVLMFSFATIINGTDLGIQSICYVDNREFPGVEGVLPPGPLGYKLSIRKEALSMTNTVMFFLSHGLADGFLVRCLFDPSYVRSSRCLMPNHPAISLLRNLLQAVQDHRPSFPHVLWLFVYVFEFSELAGDAQG